MLEKHNSTCSLSLHDTLGNRRHLVINFKHCHTIVISISSNQQKQTNKQQNLVKVTLEFDSNLLFSVRCHFFFFELLKYIKENIYMIDVCPGLPCSPLLPSVVVIVPPREKPRTGKILVAIVLAGPRDVSFNIFVALNGVVTHILLRLHFGTFINQFNFIKLFYYSNTLHYRLNTH